MCVKVTEFHLKVYLFYNTYQLHHPSTHSSKDDKRPDWTWQMRNGLKILYNSSTVFYSLQFFHPILRL